MRIVFSFISSIVWFLSRIERPAFLANIIKNVFCFLYHPNLKEANGNVADYGSLLDLFVRDLRPGLREIQGGFVSPIDGTLREYGELRFEDLLRVKGIDYSVRDLLGTDGETLKSYQDGYFFNLYLAPKDYHQVHVPFDGKISSILYIPGSLWPVNDFTRKLIPDVLEKNKRVVITIQSAFGEYKLVMIGALNVGRIRLSFDEEVSEATAGSFVVPARPGRKVYKEPLFLGKGDKLGAFELGSSVFLALSKELLDQLRFNPNLRAGPILLGQKLLAQSASED